MVKDTTIHDHSGLKLPGSPSSTAINQAELIGLGEARKWVKVTRLDVTKIVFWLRLHRKIFGGVWGWAGKLRQEDLNIGVHAYQVTPLLGALQGDLTHWLTLGPTDMPPLELL